jgi:phosphatidylinositol-bisphosphatase
VYTRLSSAHAGAPFDANGDIDIIREAWMQSQLVSVVQSAQANEEKSSLSIHVGTFNVNGKLPVEGVNLDSWLGIAHEDEKGDSAVIPPVPAVSPFEVPLPSDSDEPESVLQMKKDHQPPNVGDEPAKKPADVITLSFQELDLSTAALIYSTEKSREEAWAQAVLRSLNKSSPKGEPNYVKVGLPTQFVLGSI